MILGILGILGPRRTNPAPRPAASGVIGPCDRRLVNSMPTSLPRRHRLDCSLQRSPDCRRAGRRPQCPAKTRAMCRLAAISVHARLARVRSTSRSNVRCRSEAPRGNLGQARTQGSLCPEAGFSQNTDYQGHFALILRLFVGFPLKAICACGILLRSIRAAERHIEMLSWIFVHFRGVFRGLVGCNRRKAGGMASGGDAAVRIA